MRSFIPFRATLLSFLLILTLCVTASADFSLVGKIQAPQPEPPFCSSVTGLATVGNTLFATVVYDTSSYLYRMSPGDGEIITSYRFALPYLDQGWPQFSAAAFERCVYYWAADGQSGHFLKLLWDGGDTCCIYNQWRNSRIPTPRGLAYADSGRLWATDLCADSLFLLTIYGGVIGAYDLDVCGPVTTVTPYGDNLLLLSAECVDEAYEVTKTGEGVEVHILEDMSPYTPLGATFYDGKLYVGVQYHDSIFVYQPGYSEPVPEGDSVVVEVVPDELEVTFDNVTQSGDLYVDVMSDQPCPPPAGVVFFSNFYEVSTTAAFEYIAELELMTGTELPGWVDPTRARVFGRPSTTNGCPTWRDITVAPLEFEPQDGRDPVLRILSRTKSEEDEFSVFALAEDNRFPVDVISLKFTYLQSAITNNQDSIPEDTYNTLHQLLDQADIAFHERRFGLSARRVDRIADIVRATSSIPHVYAPDGPAVNVAGQIISRAHTLSFSLRLLLPRQVVDDSTPTGKDPDITAVGQAVGSDIPQMVIMPNPSGTAFGIAISNRGDQPIDVSVYSVRGELVRTLARDSQNAGVDRLSWDGQNDQGLPVAAGAYFVVLRQGKDTAVQTVVLQR
jgi:hypothetical protein